MTIALVMLSGITVNAKDTQTQLQEYEVTDTFELNAKVAVAEKEKERQANIEKDFSSIEYLRDVDMHQYLIEYRNIISKYDIVVTKVQDTMTPDQYYFFLQMVQQEIGGGTFEDMTHVVSVMYNRLNSGRFGNTMYDVLTQKNQFSSYSSGEYKDEIPTQDVIDAVDYVFMFGDTSGGAYFFCNKKYCDYSTFVAKYDELDTDESGHTFWTYKES